MQHVSLVLQPVFIRLDVFCRISLPQQALNYGAGILMRHWFPSVPIWIWCAVFMVLLFVLNALTTKGFAEAEFWFASIKVVAVIAFIIIGGAAIFGLIPLADRPTPHLTNLAPSGFIPSRYYDYFVTMMNVIFLIRDQS